MIRERERETTVAVTEKGRVHTRKILSQDRNRPVILKELENVIVSGAPWVV